MCTVLLLRRPDHDWPLLLAANRDEMANRPWSPPARHWDDRPDVIAGRDDLAGGTWMGLNDTGVVACVLNRYGSLGPAPGKRSRGELVLEALDHADAVDAAEALGQLDGSAYRPFNLVIADNRDAYLLRGLGEGRVGVQPLGPGLSMVTAFDLDDARDPRIATFRPQFEAAAVPTPETGDWGGWPALLAAPARAGAPETGMCFTRDDGFGTVCSSLLALPAIGSDADPIWHFAAGRPDRVEFGAVTL